MYCKTHACSCVSNCLAIRVIPVCVERVGKQLHNNFHVVSLVSHSKRMLGSTIFILIQSLYLGTCLKYSVSPYTLGTQSPMHWRSLFLIYRVIRWWALITPSFITSYTTTDKNMKTITLCFIITKQTTKSLFSAKFSYFQIKSLIDCVFQYIISQILHEIGCLVVLQLSNLFTK